jgi:hypothetical protein
MKLSRSARQHTQLQPASRIESCRGQHSRKRKSAVIHELVRVLLSVLSGRGVVIPAPILFPGNPLPGRPGLAAVGGT